MVEMEVTMPMWLALSEFPNANGCHETWGFVGIVISGNGPSVSILMVL